MSEPRGPGVSGGRGVAAGPGAAAGQRAAAGARAATGGRVPSGPRVAAASEVPAVCPPLHHEVELRELFRERGRLAFGLVRMGPGGRADAHDHPRSWHVIYVTEGRLEVTLGRGPAVVLDPGQAVLVPEGVTHATRTAGGTACGYVIVTTPPSGEEE